MSIQWSCNGHARDQKPGQRQRQGRNRGKDYTFREQTGREGPGPDPGTGTNPDTGTDTGTKTDAGPDTNWHRQNHLAPEASKAATTAPEAVVDADTEAGGSCFQGLIRQSRFRPCIQR